MKQSKRVVTVKVAEPENSEDAARRILVAVLTPPKAKGTCKIAFKEISGHQKQTEGEYTKNGNSVDFRFKTDPNKKKKGDEVRYTLTLFGFNGELGEGIGLYESHSREGGRILPIDWSIGSKDFG
jgi:hypothetical protein